jgi:hypothetical protein
MKKMIVTAIAMALSAPVWAAPQAPQPGGPDAVRHSKINKAAWIYSGAASAAVAYAIAGDSSSNEDNAAGNESGGGDSGGTTGSTGTSGTSGTTGTGG